MSGHKPWVDVRGVQRPRRGMLRKRCDLDGFHEAHEWVHELNAADRIINGTLTVTTRLWCSGGKFTGPDEIEDYLGRPWSITDVENYLAS